MIFNIVIIYPIALPTTPGIVPTHVISFHPRLMQPNEISTSIIPILQIKKLKSREVSCQVRQEQRLLGGPHREELEGLFSEVGAGPRGPTGMAWD